jgi:hypothetical protein
MKATIMIVKDGPKPLNLDVPNKGRIKLEKMPIIDEKNIPKKQYFICSRSIPVDFLYFIIKK